uniref:Threonine dehydrogenase and related Zn-dependent dehydrogenases n=1 Tax=uncultured bacterium Contigcl_23 TaxID=1393667 RepID=W0FRE3_9BACT|nr:threonine dehydrogenase and related Zn-dependent dehydrogenases [uncultured bacterium Contigcl_23]
MRGKNMKAVTIASPFTVEIREIPTPVPGPGEALLRPLYGGICGSDLNSYRGANAYLTYPRIPGHELSAEIVEIGENSRGFRAGDIVTVNPYFNCGKCLSCRRGLVNACMSNQTMGVQRDGGFSEYITMPVSRLIGGEGLDPKTLALIEPFCIGYHGIQRADVREGDSVLVVGSGTIGLLAAIAAKNRGAKVWVCDIAPKKLETALSFGLDGAILNSSPEAFEAAWKELTDGDGFDVAVECVGLPQTLQNCLDAVCFGGRVSVIGIGKKNIDLNFSVIQKKELNIFGSRNALTGDFEELIRLVKERDLRLDRVVTDEYPFSRAARAFEDFHQHADSMLKVMLKF